MIFKFVIVCALVAITASGSAIKGIREEGALKGGLKSPIEQQRLIEQHQTVGKTNKLENNLALEEQQYQKKEEVPLVAEHRNEDNWRETQQREEGELKVAPIRYEAKPQLSKDELSKVNKLEQREESKTNRLEQQKQDEKFEQFSQQKDIENQFENHGQQVVELKEEQRRVVDEQPALVQPILPLVEEPFRSEQQHLQQTKGGFVSTLHQAPIGEAEPYAFSYNVEGSSRSESGDTKGVVRGQYTLSGPDGSNRVVDYVADHNGFRANVNTNEFGTEAKSPANVALRTSQPLAEEITLRSEGKTVEGGLKSAPLVAQKPLLFEENQQVLLESPKKEWNNLQQQQQQQQLVQQTPILLAGNEGTKNVGGKKTPFEQAPILQSQINLNEQGGKKGGFEEIKREPSIKGQRNIENYPAKSAEIRTPKAILASEYKYASPNVQQRVGFESATAHRVYRQPLPLRPVVPSVLVRTHPPPAPVVRGPTSLVSRPNLQQYERYPPSPVQGYRRSHHRYEPSNPRVSFYGSNFDEDHASFEHPDS